MKDKKRVLKVLLVLIILLIVILVTVNVFGGKKTKELENYYDALEKAACKYAEEEKITMALCESYTSLCKVHFNTLVAKEYIKNKKHPLTNQKISEDQSGYIEITWENQEMKCTHKEG